MQASSEAVVLKDISKSFSDQPVLDRVNLGARTGELLSLLGPSGCGKSTLLRIIAGLESPDSGSVTILGRDVTALPPASRPVNTVFQSYALFPHLTVFENVAFGLRVRKTPPAELKRRVNRCLDLLSIAPFAPQLPGSLSGGQQQRVAVARAIVNEPAVVLLDEPLSALDRSLRRALQEELRKLQREIKSTFIFVTHDQDEAFAISDRIAVMNRGAIEQVDTPAELYSHPGSAFVASFIGDGVTLSGRVCRIENEYTEVDTAIGLIRAGSRSPQICVGSQALVMVRPESVVPEQLPGSNIIQGRVAEVRSRGHEADITLMVGPVRLMAKTPPRVAAQLENSQPEYWSVAVDSLHIVPAPLASS